MPSASAATSTLAPITKGWGKSSWRAQPVGRSRLCQYAIHCALCVRASSAMIASALSLSLRMPESFSLAVSVLQDDGHRGSPDGLRSGSWHPVTYGRAAHGESRDGGLEPNISGCFATYSRILVAGLPMIASKSWVSRSYRLSAWSWAIVFM